MNITRSIALSLSLFSFGCATVSGTTTQTSTTSQQLVIEVPNAPPDPKPEEKMPCPGPGHIWVAGYWDYIGGQHVWRDGRWVQGKPDYEYVRARYEFDGKAWQFHVPHWHRRAVTQTMKPQPVQVATAPGASSSTAHQ
ncbi:MAG TPA: YXWGXW repeat-containing protein [Polyangia bacterium]|nr:YXWGXW repeat-containing protein [Polyangia bacterium]